MSVCDGGNEATDNVAAVGGGERGDSCDFDHGVLLFLLVAFLDL